MVAAYNFPVFQHHSEIKDQHHGVDEDRRQLPDERVNDHFIIILTHLKIADRTLLIKADRQMQEMPEKAGG